MNGAKIRNTVKIYRLTESCLKRLAIQSCAECGKPLKVGDLIVSKKVEKPYRNKFIFHAGCFNKGVKNE